METQLAAIFSTFLGMLFILGAAATAIIACVIVWLSFSLRIWRKP